MNHLPIMIIYTIFSISRVQTSSRRKKNPEKNHKIVSFYFLLHQILIFLGTAVEAITVCVYNISQFNMLPSKHIKYYSHSYPSPGQRQFYFLFKLWQYNEYRYNNSRQNSLHFAPYITTNLSLDEHIGTKIIITSIHFAINIGPLTLLFTLN